MIVNERRHLRPDLTVDTVVERSQTPLNLNESHDTLTIRRHDKAVNAGLIQVGALVFWNNKGSAI